MPYLIRPSRRQFFGAALAAAGALKAASMTRWALLADTHIAADPADQNRGFHPHANLQKVAAQVREAAPEGVIINGDLARLDGKPADYEQFRLLAEPLTTAHPVGMTLGNHDDRRNFQAAFAQSPGQPQPVRGKHVLIIEHPPIRFVLLDSLFQVNQTPGLLGRAQRQWLDGYLASASNMPTLVFVHHTLDDADSALLDSDRLLRILSAHRMVKAVFYGHSHVYRVDTLDGMHLVNHPAIGYNFADTQPVGWVEGTFHAEGADLKLHAIGGHTADHGKVRSLGWRT